MCIYTRLKKNCRLLAVASLDAQTTEEICEKRDDNLGFGSFIALQIQVPENPGFDSTLCTAKIETGPKKEGRRQPRKRHRDCCLNAAVIRQVAM